MCHSAIYTHYFSHIFDNNEFPLGISRSHGLQKYLCAVQAGNLWDSTHFLFDEVFCKELAIECNEKCPAFKSTF